MLVCLCLLCVRRVVVCFCVVLFVSCLWYVFRSSFVCVLFVVLVVLVASFGHVAV